ncbi:MAG TPA: aldehyde dehydrogenase [Cyanothece sp. UBA12306]|nr:aldehyde dehydrogenase [Cyanothece sp. UBA12306]
MVNQIEVRNPRTGKYDYAIAPPTSEELTTISHQLRQQQIQWFQGGLENRIQVLQNWQEVILSYKDEILAALILDTGRKTESILEIDGLISAIDRWCNISPKLLESEAEKNSSIPFIKIKQHSKTYPLVGVISPWNFPLLLSTIDTIPALISGCSVLVKPSEITPRFIKPLLTTINAIPQLKEVFTYIAGDGKTGANLINQVDLICFTGSLVTGKKVGENAAKNFIPAFLELGGKDPAIVLETANLDLATSAILWGSVINAGQSCLSIERVYVAQSIFKPFIEKLVKKAKELNLAYPTLDDGKIGPIISTAQAEIIKTHLEDAIAKGAKVCCGGKVEQLGGGYWCHPTVLTEVNHDMKIMTEETFGPIIPVMTFVNIQEAIQLANDSIYGLSGAVFAGAENEALAVANNLEVGAISINDAGLTALIHEGEKNAFKYSGLGGSRMGAAALQRFRRKQSFMIKTQPIVDPWWF